MTDLDPGHYRNLAGDLLRDAIGVLRADPPPSRRPRYLSTTEWRKKWTQWESERRRDLTFFRDPERSAVWCEAAGVDYDVVLSRLEGEEVLYDPKDRFPSELGGRSIIRPEPKVTPATEDKSKRACPDCGISCKGYRALKIHHASCIGPERTEAIIQAYLDGVRTTDIERDHNVRGDMMYRILTANGIERRQPGMCRRSA